jgi:ArsR family transcriptional regulator
MSNSRDTEIERFADIFKALSNPHRLIIFMRLACCPPEGPCGTDAEIEECVGKVGKDLGLAPSTVSHHIKELRRAGLINMKRRGQNVVCCAVPEALDTLAKFFKQTIEA